jgi:hypothetical protein
MDLDSQSDKAQAVVDGGTEAPTPHTTSVVVWDIPSAIVAGERFRMKVGVKCADECDLTNAGFGIFDEAGTQLARGTLPGDLWPGTTGLYVAEVELAAPTTEGLYTWSVTSPASEAEIPHAAGSASFGIRVVGQPDYLVTIEAVDEADHAPLRGARVVMHPYRAVTDDRGIAEVRVAKGSYQLFVSQTRYITFGLPIEVTSDTTARAELSVEPVLERN